MVRGIHLVHVGPHRFPKTAQLCDRRRRGPFGWRQQAPAVLEQCGKAGTRAGVFSSRQRMTRHKGNTRRQMRCHRFDHRLPDRTHVRHRGTGGQMRADFGGNGPHRPYRDRQNDQIGPQHRLSRRIRHTVNKADLQCGGAGFRRPGIAHDFPRKPALAHCMGHGRRDQPQPDQRDAVIDRGHHRCPLNCATA